MRMDRSKNGCYPQKTALVRMANIFKSKCLHFVYWRSIFVVDQSHGGVGVFVKIEYGKGTKGAFLL